MTVHPPLNERIVFHPADVSPDREGVEIVDRFEFAERAASAVTVAASISDAELRDTSDVFAVEPVFDASVGTAPNASGRPDQAVARLDESRELHAVPTDGATGKGVTVAVMDTGVDDTHPVFDDVEVRHPLTSATADTTDPVGHGTAGASQYTRLAADDTIVDLRISDVQGNLSTRRILRAYEWLHAHLDDVDVLNCSWGSSRTSEQLNQIHNRVVEGGVRDVVSAGNSGKPSGSPATAERAFSVGACNEAGELAEFSSYNPNGPTNPEITAVGVRCRMARASGTSMGTVLGSEWVAASGTSFSAPFVGGLVARYRESNPEATPAEIESAFVGAADNLKGTPREGAGLVKFAPIAEGSVDSPEKPKEPEKPEKPEQPEEPTEPEQPEGMTEGDVAELIAQSVADDDSVAGVQTFGDGREAALVIEGDNSTFAVTLSEIEG